MGERLSEHGVFVENWVFGASFEKVFLAGFWWVFWVLVGLVVRNVWDSF